MSIEESTASDPFARLCQIVAKLRAPGGCPWDREQTNETLLPGLIEEAYEVAEAVRTRDDQNLCEELGDLILLAVMHAQIAAEARRFDIKKILTEVSDKLIRRHPHVFGDSKVSDSDGVVKQWEAIKREEKTDPTRNYLADIPKAFPALIRAQKAQEKAARVNFDWNEITDVIAKVDEELEETKQAIDSGDSKAVADEIGDLLFAVVNLARKSNLDGEIQLQRATDKFISRFHEVENRLWKQGRSLGEPGLDELDQLWNAVKKDAKATL